VGEGITWKRGETFISIKGTPKKGDHPLYKPAPLSKKRENSVGKRRHKEEKLDQREIYSAPGQRIYATSERIIRKSIHSQKGGKGYNAGKQPENMPAGRAVASGIRQVCPTRRRSAAGSKTEVGEWPWVQEYRANRSTCPVGKRSRGSLS